MYSITIYISRSTNQLTDIIELHIYNDAQMKSSHDCSTIHSGDSRICSVHLPVLVGLSIHAIDARVAQLEQEALTNACTMGRDATYQQRAKHVQPMTSIQFIEEIIFNRTE